MSLEDNKAIAHRFIEDFLNGADPNALDDIVATDFIHHDNTQVRDAETYKQVMLAAKAAFSETHFTIEDSITEGKTVAIRWTWRGRGSGTGDWAGTKPPEEILEGPGITMFYFSGGKIIEAWSCFDLSQFS